MDNFAQPGVDPAQFNAAPFYLPNLIAAMIASVDVVVGSIGPWITFLALSRNAVGGDGTVTLILGIVSGVALFALLNLGRSQVNAGWMVALGCIAAIAGLIAFVIAVADTFEVTSRKTDLFGQTMGAEVGWGPLDGVDCLVGAGRHILRRRQAGSEAAKDLAVELPDRHGVYFETAFSSVRAWSIWSYA